MTQQSPVRRKRARFHTLRVEQVRPLTESSVEVTFAVPEDLSDDYRFVAGQHLALRSVIDGADVRRSYSVCRPAESGRISVGVKRVQGGLFSNWINDSLRAGDELEVMTPEGAFFSRQDRLGQSHCVGIAAGSGITPIITMANDVLRAGSSSRFDLVFANRSSMDVMFSEELADLKNLFPDRFGLYHVLSQEQRAVDLLSGRLNKEKLETLFTRVIPHHLVDEWFLCGPLGLITTAREILDELGVPDRRVRFELFATDDVTGASPTSNPGTPAAHSVGTRTIEFTLDGTSGTVESADSANESILTSALRVRPDVPFSCTGGVCGTCRALLVEGSVSMRENYALEREELDRGYILTCQSRPTTDRVVVDYDA